MSRSALLPACFALLMPLLPLAAAEIARDGFESGTLAAPLWIGTTSVTTSTDRAFSGTRSARFRFTGNADLEADAFAELRFDLGAVYPEVWIRYHLYIPANYTHRDAIGTDNNKLFRLWGQTYDDIEKVGASLWLNSPANGYSSMLIDWNRHGDGIGPKGTSYQNFVGAADHDAWIDVVIHARAATSTTLGTLRVWKNGVLAVDGTGTVDNYTAGEAHGYRYGYLLGWSNSGFTATTDLFIDDVVFGTTQADVIPPLGNQAPVAMPATIAVTVDTPRPLTLTASDPNGDVLSYHIVADPTHGTVTGSGASRTYQPDPGFSGSDSFTFQVNDGLVDSNTAVITLTVAPAGSGMPDGDATPPNAADNRCGFGWSAALLMLICVLLPLHRNPTEHSFG